MIVLLRKKFLLCLVCLLILGLMVASVLYAPRDKASFSTAASEQPVVVIDAGHGGEDGGAVALDGTVESGINLAIARRLREIFLFLGTPVTMTRDEDISLSTSDSQKLREIKRSDLSNRVALVNRTPGAVLLSIHQNSLPNYITVSGAQAFYNAQQGSDALAESLQAALNTGINLAKQKTCRAIDPSIYLMKQVHCCAVLVECGFLSNREETKLLQESDYQTRIALCIAGGFEKWQNST